MTCNVEFGVFRHTSINVFGGNRYGVVVISQSVNVQCTVISVREREREMICVLLNKKVFDLEQSIGFCFCFIFYITAALHVNVYISILIKADKKPGDEGQLMCVSKECTVFNDRM